MDYEKPRSPGVELASTFDVVAPFDISTGQTRPRPTPPPPRPAGGGSDDKPQLPSDPIKALELFAHWFR